MKLNCGAERHHYSMFNVGRSMLDVQSVRFWTFIFQNDLVLMTFNPGPLNPKLLHRFKLFLVCRCVFKIVQGMVTVNNKFKALS